MIKFHKTRIVSRYRVPSILVSDNSPQLTETYFKLLCDKLKIEHHFGSVRHAQTNEQVESSNMIVMDSLMKMLDAVE